MTIAGGRRSGWERVVSGTVPYAWPYDRLLSPTRTALVVAGAQRWWADRCAPASAGAVLALERLRGGCREARLPVFLTCHTRAASPAGRPPFLPAPGTAESALALEPLPGDTVVAATGVSGCYGGPLETMLRHAGIDRVLLAGHGLEGPVHSTLRDLNDQGYECLLAADACTFGAADTAAAALSSVTMSGGIFGAVGSTESVVAALADLAAIATLTDLAAPPLPPLPPPPPPAPPSHLTARTVTAALEERHDS